MNDTRIWLSSPHMGPNELEFVARAFASNWIAPMGPDIDAFEREFAKVVGSKHALAVSSGTAALHLALRYADIQPDEEVICPTLTFAATVNPVIYMRGRPVFIDSDPADWNISVDSLRDFLNIRERHGRIPKYLIVVHLYGQSANLNPICELCTKYGITLIEDAAEALGASYGGRAPGSFGQSGIFSFNGNKIITTSGGGMLVSDDQRLIEKCRFWSTQARDPAPHYQHSEIGFNYRMSNILAAIGRGQLMVLPDRVAARRANFEFYQKQLGDLVGVSFHPEAPHNYSTRWLSCITIDPAVSPVTADQVRLALAEWNIEARPVWKPMHLQPAFREFEYVGGGVAESLFNTGLCLPSGSNLLPQDLSRTVDVIRRLWCK